MRRGPIHGIDESGIYDRLSLLFVLVRCYSSSVSMYLLLSPLLSIKLARSFEPFSSMQLLFPPYSAMIP